MIDCTSRTLKSLPNLLSITGVVSARQKEGKGKHKCEHDRAMAPPPTTVSQSWSSGVGLPPFVAVADQIHSRTPRRNLLD